MPDKTDIEENTGSLFGQIDIYGIDENEKRCEQKKRGRLNG